MAGHVHGYFQAAPDTQFVKSAAQVVLDDLLAGSDDPADFAVGQAFPDQHGDLNFAGGKMFLGGHERASSLANMAMASFTRLRPSRIPARKKSVRRCCFTVRGLMFNWPAISLLLQPCTSNSSTCWSRGVTLTSARSITFEPPGSDFRAPGWQPLSLMHGLRQFFASRAPRRLRPVVIGT